MYDAEIDRAATAIEGAIGDVEFGTAMSALEYVLVRKIIACSPLMDGRLIALDLIGHHLPIILKAESDRLRGVKPN